MNNNPLAPPNDDEQNPFEQEAAVLRFFKENFSTNPKKLNKLARRIYNDQPVFIRLGILHNVMVAADPVGYLRKAIDEMEDFPRLIKEMIDNGNHGMIRFKGQLYPLSLKAQSHWLKEDDKWNYDEELEIQDRLINQWMEAYNLTVVKDAKIVLFQHFGFSGMPRGFCYGID